MCARFGISEQELVADLDIAAMVGAESSDYTDMPIEVGYEAGRVQVFLFAFRRPLRLTPEQGLALVAAGTGLRGVAGADPSGPLARALATLAAVLGIDPSETIDIDLGPADGTVLDLLRTAGREHRQVTIDYWSAGRDDHTRRTVDPWRVFNDGGAWYLQAHCHSVSGERVFRVDRIRHAEALDSGFEPPGAVPAAAAYRAGADDPRVVLDLDRDVAWVPTAYPVDEVVELGDGRLRVTMPAAAPAWLARLLLRLGPAARIVEIDQRSGGPDLAAATARRILRRYVPEPA
ncbi:MAG: WYL domain-containing protein [Acidimicrobiales bacterium]